jgi:hypothetical protein
MTNSDIVLSKNVPQNSIGVSTTTDHKSTLTPRKVVPITNYDEKFENANHVVDELVKLKGIEVKGKRRRILEYIAKCVLRSHYPTSKEIGDSLNIKKVALKKFLYRLRKLDLVVLYPTKEGRYQRYSLYNMQDFDLNFEDEYYSGKKINSKNSGNDHQFTGIEHILLQMAAVSQLADTEKILFHHISLSSKFDSKEHYLSLKWKKYQRNKGKTIEYRISRNRSCIITVYPTNTVTIVIKCSKDPYDLISDDGYTNFVGDCGEIHRMIKDEMGINQVLLDNISDWKVIQIDCALDIKTKDIEDLLNSQQKYRNVTFKSPGTVRVKDLNQIYQIYTKYLPTKGACLRIEKRLSFNKDQPTLPQVIDHYKNSNAS